MSDHPSSAKSSPHHHSAALILVSDRHRNQKPPPQLPAGLPIQSSNAAPSPLREYRKGNWTLHETLVLITAKRLDDERRSRGGAAEPKPPAQPSQGQPSCRSAEQRWKWVENYCWNHQCFRSQNQCNDKWDNLLRDYKKVRDYEARRSSSSTSDKGEDKDGGNEAVLSSYWSMEKHERKERNLPSNLVQEVFDALTYVLSRRNAVKPTTGSNAMVLTPRPPSPAERAAAAPEPLPPFGTRAAAPSPPPLQQQEPQRQPSISELSSSSDAASDERDERDDSSDIKRRKVRNVGASVVRGASVLARALLACEEKRSKRHQDLLDLEERRLHAEEHRVEMHRQGLAGLIDAVNNLAGAVNALVSDCRSEMQQRR